MPWKRGSLLLVIVNEIYFIRDQSFWTKDFCQAFWFSRCVIIQERQPNQTCHENKKIKNKIMPSSMTIITVTQELSEARGCRSAHLRRRNSKTPFCRRTLHVFSFSHTLHVQYNRNFKAKLDTKNTALHLKNPRVTYNGWLPLKNGDWKSNPEFSVPPLVTEADGKK